MTIKAGRTSDSGLTLIELVVAMTILALGAVAALATLVEAHKSNNMARARTLATNATEEQMENIFAAAPALVFSFDDTAFAVGDLVGNGPNGEPGWIDVGLTEPHLVTVTVAWRGQGTLPTGTVMLRAVRSEATR